MVSIFSRIITDAMGSVPDSTTVKPAEVHEVIRITKSKAQELGTDDFKQAKGRVSRAAFGSYEGADVVVDRHAKAHTVTQDTIVEVKEALLEFARQLELSLGATENADLLSKDTLDKLALVTPGDAGQTTHAATEGQTGIDLNDTKSADADEGTD